MLLYQNTQLSNSNKHYTVQPLCNIISMESPTFNMIITLALYWSWLWTDKAHPLIFFVISMESLQWEFGRTHICNKEVSLCFTNPGIGNYVYYVCTLRRKNLQNQPSCPSVAWQARLQANQFPCSLCIHWRLVYPLLYVMQPELTYTSAVMQHSGSGIEGWHRWQLLFQNKNIARILIAYLYMLTKCISILLWDNILKDFIVINVHFIYSCISDFSDKDTILKRFLIHLQK